MSIKTKILSLSKRHERSEEGITLIELLVAMTILAIVVVFSSTMFVTSFRTSANMENRAKALQIANDVISIAEQSPYRQLYTPTMSSNVEMFNTTANANSEKCDVDPRLGATNPTKFGGTMVKQPADYSTAEAWAQYREFKGLVYCQKRYFGQEDAEQVGTTFFVQTDIVYANLESADTPSRAEAGGTPTAENIKGKRVVVTVRWKDTHSGSNKSNKVVLQQMVIPNAWDCPVGSVSAPATNTASNNAASNGILGC